ncbi:MAG: LysE family translocator [Betaproteobacteria bacterium]|nr:LysE family translocator [Betaproteobacteria bacterium]
MTPRYAVFCLVSKIHASVFDYGGKKTCDVGAQALRIRGAFAPRQKVGALRRWTIFRQSVLGNIMNPKVTLFFLVFLPQFVDPKGQTELQMALLGVLFMLQTVVIFGGIGLAAGWIGKRLLQRPATAVRLNRLAGLVFILIGVRPVLAG